MRRARDDPEDAETVAQTKRARTESSPPASPAAAQDVHVHQESAEGDTSKGTKDLAKKPEPTETEQSESSPVDDTNTLAAQAQNQDIVESKTEDRQAPVVGKDETESKNDKFTESPNMTKLKLLLAQSGNLRQISQQSDACFAKSAVVAPSNAGNGAATMQAVNQAAYLMGPNLNGAIMNQLINANMNSAMMANSMNANLNGMQGLMNVNLNGMNGMKGTVMANSLNAGGTYPVGANMVMAGMAPNVSIDPMAMAMAMAMYPSPSLGGQTNYMPQAGTMQYLKGNLMTNAMMVPPPPPPPPPLNMNALASSENSLDQLLRLAREKKVQPSFQN